jgi:hypothetical protein
MSGAKFPKHRRSKKNMLTTFLTTNTAKTQLDQLIEQAGHAEVPLVMTGKGRLRKMIRRWHGDMVFRLFEEVRKDVWF